MLLMLFEEVVLVVLETDCAGRCSCGQKIEI